MPITSHVSVSRRQAISHMAAAGMGAAGVLYSGTGLLAQVAGIMPVKPQGDPNYPMPPTWDAQTKEVAPGAYAFIQAGGPGRDNASVSNAGFIVGDEGVLVIDTTVAPMHARALISSIRKVTDKPFRHVVITHSHGDHYNGTQYFPGAEVISHPYVRDEILKATSAPGPALWPKHPGWADGTEPRHLVPPSLTFEGVLSLYYGKTQVQLLQLTPAHTYGDTVVYLPQYGVIWLGDIAFFYVAPWLQNAAPSQWISTCRTIESMNVQSIIPGHGPLGGKAELADMRGYLELLKAESRKQYDAGVSAGVAAANIRLGRYDNWIGPERIVMGVQRFYQEFDNKLSPDVDVADLSKATEEYNAIKTAEKR